jgi:hypothetical protein
MPFVIHVGTHKTGTTAVQRFASANRAELKDRGLWYPSYGEIGLFDHYAHHHLAFALAEESGKRLSSSEARRFIEYLDRNRTGQETVFISAEPLYRLTFGLNQKTHKWRSSSASYWEARDRFIAKLRDAFPFDDVQILICLRRQDTFARSVYQERIKVTKFHDTFATFLHKERSIFDYLGQVEAFAKHFQNVRVVTFESLIATGDLHSAFFDLLDADISFTQDRPVTNVSLPIEFVEFKRLLNMTQISRENVDKIGKRLLGLAKENVLNPARDLDWLPFDDMLSFQGSFERDNERLRQRFAPTLPLPLFQPPEREKKKHFTGLSPTRAVQIAQLFMDESS